MRSCNEKHEISERIPKNNPNLDKELLARSMELAKILKANGMKPHGYTLGNPSVIRRIHLVQHWS